MDQKTPCRIDGIVAAEANVVVIFRRGPTKHVQMLVWDLNTDEVTPGQWLNGRVYTHRSDVTPDGRYAVIAVSKHSGNHLDGRNGKHPLPPDSRNYDGFTAICRPPYFSALAIWFSNTSYSGGGVWADNRKLLLNPSPVWYPSTPPDPSVTIEILDPTDGEEALYRRRLLMRGWQETREKVVVLKRLMRHPSFGDKVTDWFTLPALESPGLMEKPFVNGTLIREIWLDNGEWSIAEVNGKKRKVLRPKNGNPQWLDLDGNGRPIFAERGCLWAWASFPEGEPELIADLNANKFSPIPPPEWATQW